jgi:hypothetical protein
MLSETKFHGYAMRKARRRDLERVMYTLESSNQEEEPTEPVDTTVRGVAVHYFALHHSATLACMKMASPDDLRIVSRRIVPVEFERACMLNAMAIELEGYRMAALQARLERATPSQHKSFYARFEALEQLVDQQVNSYNMCVLG